MRLPVILLVLVILGCGGPQAANNAVPAVDLKTTYGANLDREYGIHILGCLEHFDLVAKKAETVDDASWETYRKEGRFSKKLLQQLNEGLALENAWYKQMANLHPPLRFETFHWQVLKNTQNKIDNLAALILAMEKGDKAEIAKVLDQVEVSGKLNKSEMDKILGGKTAEEYLGLKGMTSR